VLVVGLVVLGVYGLSVERPEIVATPLADLLRRLWGLSSPFTALVVILAAVLGSSMVNDDINRGTIVGVLARPVSRSEYFVCSWVGAAAVLIGLDLLRVAVTVGCAIAFEGHVPVLLGIGMVATLAGDLLTLATFSAIGAIWSTGATVLAGVSLLVIEALAFAPKIPAWLAVPLRAIGVVLPTPLLQESTIMSALLGEIRDVVPVIEIVAYRLCWMVVLVALGAALFRRRDVISRASD